MTTRVRRGSTLVVVLVVMAVLSVLAIGAIAFTGTERDAAIHESRAAEMQSCVETARAHLLARLRVTGISPSEITFAEALLDDYDADKRTMVRTGHLHDLVDGGAPEGVTLVVGGVGAMSSRSRDLTNLIAAGGTLGGQYYRVVVACEQGNRQREVEFLVRFGI